MPDTDSITIVKAFTYRGLYEEFSNKYHFSGGQPADLAAWTGLSSAIIAKERPCVSPKVSFVRAYGYKAGTEHSIVQIDYTVPPNDVVVGTFSPGALHPNPGDAAVQVRWDTGYLTSRGKKIYCRKYFHDVYSSAADPDHVDPTQVAALNTYAAGMIDGTLPGGRKYCGPQGAALYSPLVGTWVTTRTLKRRGKRPLP